jgi:hypothetical protein
VKFEWTPKCEERFQQLKDILTSVPILKIAYIDEYFFVCTNACKEGLGGVLGQKYHVVCYESRKLKEHERNYATHDLDNCCIENAETLPHGKEILTKDIPLWSETFVCVMIQMLKIS